MIHNWSEQIGVQASDRHPPGGGLDLHQQLRGAEAGQDHPDISHGAGWTGKNCFSRFNTVAIAHPSSELDLGSRVIMNAEGSRCDIISRTITTGGKVIARGQMIGAARASRGTWNAAA